MEKLAIVKKIVLGIICFPITFLRALRKGYKAISNGIEESLAQMNSGSRFLLTHGIILFSAIVASAAAIHANNVRKANPFDLGAGCGWGVFAGFLLWFCIYLWIRYCCADAIWAKDQRIKSGLELIPDTWARLWLSVDHSPDTIIDYNNFSRKLVYYSMSDWQRAISDRDWVEKTFIPRGYALEDCYAIYKMEAGRKVYTHFDFYLRKGEELVHVAMYPSAYEVELVEMKSYNERYNYKTYTVRSKEGKCIRQVLQVLKEMYNN